jgi:hypothetical protein
MAPALGLRPVVWDRATAVANLVVLIFPKRY